MLQDDSVYDWNEGKLLHYGRTELKQSDHRPVIAILSIEISKIDTQRRQNVFHDVIRDLGPFDCTIVIHVCIFKNCIGFYCLTYRKSLTFF